MTQPWRSLAVAAVLSAMFGVGTAAAQIVIARNVPAGEQVEVMLNGKPVGSGAPDASGDAKVSFKMQDSLAKSEIDANVFVDKCEAVHRVWIVEVGTPAPSAGTCNLRAISGLYWVRPVNTILINDITAAVPTLLLFKGSYTPPAPGQEPAASAPPREIPKGLVLFGGGGFAQTGNVTAAACGNVSDCSGSESGLGFTAGAEYRFTRVLSAEVSYVRPPEVSVKGSGSTYTFTSNQNAHVFTIAGKIGVQAGSARLYGRGGATYHQAKIDTSQVQQDRTVTVDDVPVTVPGGTQTWELKTDGWGWIFGGGLEVWVSRSFAIYGEFGYGAVKGSDVDHGEARIDDRLTSVLGGLRVHLGR